LFLPSGNDGVVGGESVNGSVLQAQGNYAHTLAVFHDQVQSKVLNEEVSIVFQRLEIK
jgi:hypothetical protein